MKKCVYFALFAVILFITAGCHNSVYDEEMKLPIDTDAIVIVNNSCIYESAIKRERVKINFFIEFEGEVLPYTKMTDEDILKDLIRREAIYTYAIKEGFSAKKEDARKLLEQQWEEMYQYEESAKFSERFILDMMEVLNLIREEYTEYLISEQRRLLVNSRFKKSYLEDCTDEDPEEAYRKFVEELVSKANIVYKNVD